jgi:hypothetical protein
LMTISRLASLIEQHVTGNDTEGLQAWTDTIKQAAGVMERLIGELLDFGSLEDGRLRVASERQDIRRGLYISMWIVEAHSGRTWADSRVGLGTTFDSRCRRMALPTERLELFDNQRRRHRRAAGPVQRPEQRATHEVVLMSFAVGGGHLMPCLLLILLLAFPRIALVYLYVTGTYLQRAFQNNLVIPLVGFIFLPLTTLAFAWMTNTHQAIAGINLVILIVTVVIDLGGIGGGGGYRRRRSDI